MLFLILYCRWYFVFIVVPDVVVVIVGVDAVLVVDTVVGGNAVLFARLLACMLEWIAKSMLHSAGFHRSLIRSLTHVLSHLHVEKIITSCRATHVRQIQTRVISVL